MNKKSQMSTRKVTQWLIVFFLAVIGVLGALWASTFFLAPSSISYAQSAIGYSISWLVVSVFFIFIVGIFSMSLDNSGAI